MGGDEEEEEEEEDAEEEASKKKKKDKQEKELKSAPKSLSSTVTKESIPQKKILLTKKAGSGLQISASYSRSDNTAFMNTRFENKSSIKLDSFAMRFDSNDLGCTPKGK